MECFRVLRDRRNLTLLTNRDICKRCTVISLCNLCVLCVSEVSFGCKSVNHRNTEDAEVAQRRAIY